MKTCSLSHVLAVINVLHVANVLHVVNVLHVAMQALDSEDYGANHRAVTTRYVNHAYFMHNQAQ
jgi:hypothetical protein